MRATENTEGDLLTQAVIGAALEAHRLLGPGLWESIYEEALCHEFGLRGIRFERQKPVDVIHKEIVIQGQRLDLLAEGEPIVALKSLTALPEVALTQGLSHLGGNRLQASLPY